MPPAIRTSALTKHYGLVRAVREIDLTVAAGEVYGFLGRNGAGKTTTIRLLLGMLRPTAGHAELLGQRVGGRGGGGRDSRGRGGRSLWRRVGYLVETATAYPELTVRENLEVARRLQGVGDARRVDREIERLGLAPYADRRARVLSTGNLQRLALARALLHEPELVLLDEPTAGLDPAGVVEVRELILDLAREHGTTVFMSSHVLTEVERVATRVGVVHQGRLVAELSTSELDLRRRRRLEVGARDLDAAGAVLRGAGYAAVRRDQVLELPEERAVAAPDAVARLLVSRGQAPTRLAVVQEDMESFFLSLTEGEGEGAP